MHHREKSWTEASAACKKNGSDLAVFRSAEEQETALARIGGLDIGVYWIGIHVSKDTTWGWLDGSEIKWNSWSDSEPNGSGECARVYRTDSGAWKWGDTPCSNIYPYICGVGKNCIIFSYFVHVYVYLLRSL